MEEMSPKTFLSHDAAVAATAEDQQLPMDADAPFDFLQGGLFEAQLGINGNGQLEYTVPAGWAKAWANPNNKSFQSIRLAIGPSQWFFFSRIALGEGQPSLSLPSELPPYLLAAKKGYLTVPGPFTKHVSFVPMAAKDRAFEGLLLARAAEIEEIDIRYDEVWPLRDPIFDNLDHAAEVRARISPDAREALDEYLQACDELRDEAIDVECRGWQRWWSVFALRFVNLQRLSIFVPRAFERYLSTHLGTLLRGDFWEEDPPQEETGYNGTEFVRHRWARRDRKTLVFNEVDWRAADHPPTSHVDLGEVEPSQEEEIPSGGSEGRLTPSTDSDEKQNVTADPNSSPAWRSLFGDDLSDAEQSDANRENAPEPPSTTASTSPPRELPLEAGQSAPPQLPEQINQPIQDTPSTEAPVNLEVSESVETATEDLEQLKPDIYSPDSADVTTNTAQLVCGDLGQDTEALIVDIQLDLNQYEQTTSVFLTQKRSEVHETKQPAPVGPGCPPISQPLCTGTPQENGQPSKETENAGIPADGLTGTQVLVTEETIPSPRTAAWAPTFQPLPIPETPEEAPKSRRIKKKPKTVRLPKITAVISGDSTSSGAPATSGDVVSCTLLEITTSIAQEVLPPLEQGRKRTNAAVKKAKQAKRPRLSGGLGRELSSLLADNAARMTRGKRKTRYTGHY